MNKEDQILDETLIARESDGNKEIRFPLIDAGAIVTNGLAGMLLCIVPGAIIGLIFIKRSLDQSRDAREVFEKYPGAYSEKAIRTVKKGRTMAYIGLGLFIAEITAIVVYSAMA